MNNYYQKNIQPEISKLIYLELQRFPQAELIDIYKLFHQDYFGPGHFIVNKKGIISYLITELDNMHDKDEQPLNQDISCLNSFVRVDIRWISQGYISVDDLAEMFWKSSVEKLDQPIAWHLHWQKIYEMLHKEHPDFNCDNADQISNYAQKEKALHHSDIYRKVYRPHYRIISKKLWEL